MPSFEILRTADALPGNWHGGGGDAEGGEDDEGDEGEEGGNAAAAAAAEHDEVVDEEEEEEEDSDNDDGNNVEEEEGDGGANHPPLRDVHLSERQLRADAIRRSNRYCALQARIRAAGIPLSGMRPCDDPALHTPLSLREQPSLTATAPAGLPPAGAVSTVCTLPAWASNADTARNRFIGPRAPTAPVAAAQQQAARGDRVRERRATPGTVPPLTRALTEIDAMQAGVGTHRLPVSALYGAYDLPPPAVLSSARVGPSSRALCFAEAVSAATTARTGHPVHALRVMRTHALAESLGMLALPSVESVPHRHRSRGGVKTATDDGDPMVAAAASSTSTVAKAAAVTTGAAAVVPEAHAARALGRRRGKGTAAASTPVAAAGIVGCSSCRCGCQWRLQIYRKRARLCVDSRVSRNPRGFNFDSRRLSRNGINKFDFVGFSFGPPGCGRRAFR